MILAMSHLGHRRLVGGSCAAVLLSCRPGPPPIPTAMTTVVGIVLDSAGVRPVHPARVDLVGTTIFALGDTLGRFVLTPVPVGRHTLRVKGIGFLPRDVNIVAQADTVRVAPVNLWPNHLLDSVRAVAPE